MHEAAIQELLKNIYCTKQVEEKHQHSKEMIGSEFTIFFPPVAMDWIESSPKPSRGHTGKSRKYIS